MPRLLYKVAGAFFRSLLFQLDKLVGIIFLTTILEFLIIELFSLKVQKTVYLYISHESYCIKQITLRKVNKITHEKTLQTLKGFFMCY